ncbi:MAG: hypothetical protein IH612_02090 [Desulfofustis sp.]|nr:hypothetical protein [Desulfofustis sp.]
MEAGQKEKILEQWGYCAPWLQRTLIKGFVDSLIAGRSATWLDFLAHEFGMDDDHNDAPD